MGKYAIVFLSLVGLATLGAAAPRHLSGPGGFAPTPTGPPRESRYHTTSEAEPTSGESHARTTSRAESLISVTYIDPDGTGTSDGYGPMPTEVNGTFSARDVPEVTYYPTNVTGMPTWTSESCTKTVTEDEECLDFGRCEPTPGICTEQPRRTWVVSATPTTTATSSGDDDRDGGHGSKTEFPSPTMITDYSSPPPFLSKTILASLDAVSSTTTGEAEISPFPCVGNSSCV
ncbi:hypothetical protein EDD36DRAFT_158551 [Exophiala viscosa]|uniref:Uncharacterized protein n=1 Tax=Exophiala viscosa TaxID=2486360 RepID=A0AAN6E327_9EURO|nr:hypothetical protein EDD36DRAFT_158551 [Exophiala viscosa]